MVAHSISRRAFLGFAGAASALAFTRLRAQEPPGGTTGPDFPIVDYHVHVEGGTTIQHVLELARQRGVKVGIAEHGGVGEGMKTDADIAQYLARWEGQPVYRGMQGGGLTWSKMFSKPMIARLDYVLSDALNFPDKDGKLIKLWTPEAVITDAEDFIE